MLAGTVTRAPAIALANHPRVTGSTSTARRGRSQASPQSPQVLIHSDQANAGGLHRRGRVGRGHRHRRGLLHPERWAEGPFPTRRSSAAPISPTTTATRWTARGTAPTVAGIIAAAAPASRRPRRSSRSRSSLPRTPRTPAATTRRVLRHLRRHRLRRHAHGATSRSPSINLSPRRHLRRRLDHGYCDADDPGSAAAIDAAIRCGMIVAVASGNEAPTNALTAPGVRLLGGLGRRGVLRHATRAAAGPTTSGGDPLHGLPDGPDQSSASPTPRRISRCSRPARSGSSPTRARASTLFAGTSASTPAAAGAVALLRQVHPTLPPASIIGILRSTGTPITDPRNGVTTPRIDTLAAVQLDPSTFFPFLGSRARDPRRQRVGDRHGRRSPDSRGRIAGVEVWVEIDHPRSGAACASR